MSNWSNNNLACQSTWIALYSMKQLDQVFKKSGDIKMSNLAFYNNLSSSEALNDECAIIADHLDGIFRNADGAKFENGKDHTSAMTNMIKVLANPNKTVADLANTADQLYKFWGE